MVLHLRLVGRPLDRPDLPPAGQQLRATFPIRRVGGPADVATLAIQNMINEALTGATYDIDGGQQLVAG